MRNPLNAIESTALPDPELLLSKIAAGDRDALAQLYAYYEDVAQLDVLKEALVSFIAVGETVFTDA